MKPIDRIARLETAAADPVPTADMVAWLAHESRWLTAFVYKLMAVSADTVAQTRAERDDGRTRPENEPGDHRCMNTYVEGADFVDGMVRDWLHNDPDVWAAAADTPQNPYYFEGNTIPAPDRPRPPFVLEFEPPEGEAP